MSPAVVFATAADLASLSTVTGLSLSETKAQEINKRAQWKVLGIVRCLSRPLSDEFGERIAFCGSHEKFVKCLA
jgi:hypothetical protein